MATAEDKHDDQGRGRKAPSPRVRAELYAVVRPMLLRRGTGTPIKKRRGRFGSTGAALIGGFGAFAAMFALFLLGFIRREMLTLLLVFGAILLDTDQHSSPAAETYTSTQAASFYTNVNGGGNGTIRFTFQPSAASSTYLGGNFHALFADNSQHGGIWLNDAKIEMYTAPGDALVFSQAMTWSANQTMTITIVTTSGSRAITIAGATTGTGTFTFSTAPNYFDNTQSLGVGSLPGSSGFRFSGVIGDVDNGSTAIVGTGAITFANDTTASTADATVVGTAAIALASDTLSSAAVSTVVGASSITLADDTLVAAGNAGQNGGDIHLDDDVVVGTAAASIVGQGAIQFASDTTSGLGASSTVGAGAITLADDTVGGAGSLPISGSGAITFANDVVAGAGTVPNGFGPGVASSAIATFGHATATLSAPGGYLPAGGGGADVDGRTPTPVNTQTTGSSFYAAIGRPVAIAGSKNLTDNKGNTGAWSEIRTDNYSVFNPVFTSWEAAIAVCIDGFGGTNHVVTTPCVAGDEGLLGWSEIQQGHHRVQTSFAARTIGQTQISAPVSCNGPAVVYVDWMGGGPTFGADGFVWTVTATGEGTNIDTDWVVEDSRIVNHNDGWFQWKRWKRRFAAKTTNIQLSLAALNPNQGAFFYASVFQEALFIDADAAITFANDTVVGAGVVSATGAAAIQYANDAIVGAGESAVTATGLAPNAADASTVAGTATASVVGQGAITFADDTVAGAGLVADGPVATGAVQLDADTVAGTAASSIAGGGAQAFANDTVAGVGSVTAAGTGAITFADDTVVGAGSTSPAGTGAIQLADDVVVGAGIAVDPGTILGVGAITFDDDAITSDATAAIDGAGAIQLANDVVAGTGIVDVGDLPPKPIAVTFARPVAPPREPTRVPNPRPITPDIAPGLGLNRRPERSLVEDFGPMVDDMRQMLVDVGLRYYQVFSVVVRWSGGERGRGTPTVIFERAFLPVPKVEGINRASRSLRSGGTVTRGEISLSQISPRYTQDDIVSLFPRELRDDEEHFIEVRGDGRDGSTPRARYTVSGVPERRALDWTVRLEKQDEDRTRGGRPR